MKKIPLTQERITLVDDADFDYINQWKWHYERRKYTGYATRRQYLGGGRKNQRQKKIYMHRVIMNPPSDLMVDHINKDGLDNRRENLRMVTRSQNAINSHKRRNTVSQYRGVVLTEGLWMACITTKGKHIYLGKFKTEIEAAKAYDVAAQDHHGDFAQLNFSRR